MIDNRRIAKNTVFLYFRTFIILLISLYTSRAVLDALGETDYGIYNLVGGIVILFSFMNSAMSAATQRYLNFEIGRNDETKVERVFSMSLTVHFIIAIGVFIAGETLGLWFVMTQLNIPPDRFSAAQWVYQFSLIGCCVNILRIPYNACIIAYERMSFYAYASIIDAILRLAIVYLLVFGTTDRLVFYAFLMFVVISIVNGIYVIYCHHNFEISHYHYFWDKSLFKQLISFSGWSMFGSLANAGIGQGLSILLNIFYGVTLNAALGISHQVHSAISSFVSSFQTAFSPQIVKSYAANQHRDFYTLICRSSRLSYCLVFLFAPAIIFFITPILNVWLTIVPEYTNSFSVTMIILCMIDALSGPLWVSVQATGNIKNYQILLTSIALLNLPLMLILLLAGVSPVWVVGVRVLIGAIIHFVRIGYLGKVLSFPVKTYMTDVMARTTVMTLISFPTCFLLSSYNRTILTSIFAFLAIIIQNAILAYLIGLLKSERKAIKAFVATKFKSLFVKK